MHFPLTLQRFIFIFPTLTIDSFFPPLQMAILLIFVYILIFLYKYRNKYEYILNSKFLTQKIAYSKYYFIRFFYHITKKCWRLHHFGTQIFVISPFSIASYDCVCMYNRIHVTSPLLLKTWAISKLGVLETIL